MLYRLPLLTHFALTYTRMMLLNRGWSRHISAHMIGMSDWYLCFAQVREFEPSESGLTDDEEMEWQKRRTCCILM